MKNDVQTFCQQFSTEIDPFASRLDEAITSLADQIKQSGLPDLPQLNSALLRMRETQQRLSTLQDKIGGQKTFLLIFGPLKSGKSTLMNAISGAYVSEVSSLPAYPALVYVTHGENRRFQATTYEGEKRVFSDNIEMANAVQEDHARLASAILEVEKTGQEFDPKDHYPSAIRRMDVEAPAENLAKSGSVLVDTPGLYSRMKFGYDLMTRDFRDTAACAIFVVKTDNLFFEKVFEEFEDLLGCFSRIFLVSNIDTSKQDLKPDGTLEASLESRDPQKVIDAFRSLSMSATLRAAIDEGRLSIYPIDLLRAASRRLRAGGASDEEAGSAAADVEDEIIDFDSVEFGDNQEEDHQLQESGQEPMQSDGFDHFLDDLTTYLNSSDYLRDFMFDSLRVAQDLTAETSQLVENEASAALHESARQLQQSLDGIETRLESLDSLEKMNWADAFESLHLEKDRLLEDLSKDHSQKLGETLQEAVKVWMQSDESLNELLENLNQHVKRETNSDVRATLEQLSSRVGDAHGGARFSTSQLEAFDRAELRVSEIAPPLLSVADESDDTSSVRIEIAPESIPVNRTLGDLLLFRSAGKARAQLFGSEGDQAIPAAKKQKRLGGAGLQWLEETVQEFSAQELPSLQTTSVNRMLARYVTDFSQALTQSVEELKARLATQSTEVRAGLKANQQIQQLLDETRNSTERFGAALTELRRDYGVEESPASDPVGEFQGEEPLAEETDEILLGGVGEASNDMESSEEIDSNEGEPEEERLPQ